MNELYIFWNIIWSEEWIFDEYEWNWKMRIIIIEIIKWKIRIIIYEIIEMKKKK